ncbi:hypothetical protein L596_009180 [Steinernema carpocapsae]|uniref:Uncharacterized protein n=1 Tax=Steinernema carpocapsae TaxID=34508 RepID=A0A4U5PFT9_STECR|nr:hypothetical protein L596_009180 [Steinernema carpocapsae]
MHETASDNHDFSHKDSFELNPNTPCLVTTISMSARHFGLEWRPVLKCWPRPMRRPKSQLTNRETEIIDDYRHFQIIDRCLHI